MSADVVVSKTQGSTMGTVIAKVTDPAFQVREVNFYYQVPARGTGWLGPYPPDIVRRPVPGVYEKDILLDSEYDTEVATDVIQDDGTLAKPRDIQTFGKRTAAAGGTGAVQVQDADTAAVTATTLAFQGAVVSVANGVATFNLDGRYVQAGHTHSFASLTNRPTTQGGYGIVGGLTGYATGYGSGGAGALTVAGNGAPRFIFGLIGTEDGVSTSTAGGDLALWHYRNDGVFRGKVLSVNRSTGVVDFSSPPTVGGIAIPLANHDHDSVYLKHNAENTSGALGFGSRLGQHINLWGTSYGLGMQGASLYFRTAFDAGFRWYAGGAHSSTDGSPGSGGVQAMALDNTGHLTTRMGISAGGNVSSGGYVQSNGHFYGAGLSYLELTNTAAAFLTSAGAALQGRFGGLLVSDSYGDTGYVPAAGIAAKGYLRSFGSGGGVYLDNRAGSGGGGHSWIIHNSADVMRWWSTASSVDRMTLSQSGELGVSVGVRTGEFWASGWYRSTAANVGMYNESLGTHFYAASDGYAAGWNITGSGICLRTGFATGLTNAVGWLLQEGTCIGLKHSGRDWAVRAWNGGVELYGNVSDQYGHSLAGVVVSSVAPDNTLHPARQGSLWIQV